LDILRKGILKIGIEVRTGIAGKLCGVGVLGGLGHQQSGCVDGTLHRSADRGGTAEVDGGADKPEQGEGRQSQHGRNAGIAVPKESLEQHVSLLSRRLLQPRGSTENRCCFISFAE
jgi:hypothetical protein